MFKLNLTEKSLLGTQAFGLRIPFIKQGDAENLMNVIMDRYNQVGPERGDIIGITESVVARNAGMYIIYDEIGQWVDDYNPRATSLYLMNPIFSRNRFLPILRGFCKSKNIRKIIVISDAIDEVGNTIEHQITGVNYRELYQKTVEDSGKDFVWTQNILNRDLNTSILVDCRLHKMMVSNNKSHITNLMEICNDKSSWGLLGMNMAGDDRLKLFPDKDYSQWFVNTLQEKIKKSIGYDVEVMIYGDGAFKDPGTGIWEWADPVVSPAWTGGLNGMPTELKLKNAIDSGMSNNDILKSIAKNRESQGQELGTTPRKIVDLLGSLMDLISGSGDKGTPVVIVRDYFKKYID